MRQVCVLVLLAVLAVSLSLATDDTQNGDNLLTFEEFLQAFPHKQYDNEERQRRRDIFETNTKKIAEHNKKFRDGLVTYDIGQDFDTDLTEEEQMALLSQSGTSTYIEPFNGTTIVKSEHVSRLHIELPRVVRQVLGQKREVPAKTLISDLRKCSPFIKSQSECGACYAFAMTSYLEWHFCLQTNQLIRFAPQPFIDCGMRYSLRGCNGSSMKSVRNYVRDEGLFLEDFYPYKGKSQACGTGYLGDTNSGSPTPQIRVRPWGWKKIVPDANEWKALLKEEPILIEISAPKDFSKYKAGIHDGHNCQRSDGHAMLVVGYGQEKGINYFLIKNSYGEYWGESGYIRMSESALLDPKRCFDNAWKSHWMFEEPKKEGQTLRVTPEERMRSTYEKFTAYARRDLGYRSDDDEHNVDEGRHEEDARAPNPDNIGK